MAAKIRREDLKKGDYVNVIVRYGADGELIKRKKGRVADVLRSAARLENIEGETRGRTVKFAELELIRPEPPPPAPRKDGVVRRRRRRHHGDHLKAVPPAFEGLAQKDPEVVHRRSRPVEAVTPPEPEPEVAERVSYEDWVSQGSEIQGVLIDKANAVENERDELLREQMRLEDVAKEKAREVTVKDTELMKLRAQIELLDSLRNDS